MSMKSKELKQFFNLLDTLPNPVTFNELTYDEEGVPYDKIIYVNKSFSKLIGYMVEDIPDDRTWFIKAYPDDKYQQYISTEWFKAVEKSKRENSDLTGFSAKVHCKDGIDRWFNITTQLEHSIHEKYRTIVFIQTDPPEQSKVELDKKSIELTQVRLLNKTIIDTAPVSIFWKDINGVFLGCNQAFLSSTHLDNESDIIGKTDFDMVWKEDAERFRKDDKAVQESGVAKLNYLEPQPQEDGKTLMLSTSKVPLKDSLGNTIGILGLYQDITQEYEMKRELKNQEELMVIQSRHAGMGEMISMIAHQWRQPLSVITMGANNLLLDIEMDNIKPDDFRNEANSIIEQAHHLSQTIEDFRNYFRPYKEKESTTLETVIHEALNLVNTSLESHDIEVVFLFLSTSPIEIYKRELIQALINIINNAKESMLNNSQSERKLLINTKETSDEVIIEICDNGRGIDKEIMANIFEPYFSTKDEKTGTGLGLFMSKTIIEKHLNGKIKATNHEAGGACFILSLFK